MLLLREAMGWIKLRLDIDIDEDMRWVLETDKVNLCTRSEILKDFMVLTSSSRLICSFDLIQRLPRFHGRPRQYLITLCDVCMVCLF